MQSRVPRENRVYTSLIVSFRILLVLHIEWASESAPGNGTLNGAPWPANAARAIVRYLCTIFSVLYLTLRIALFVFNADRLRVVSFFSLSFSLHSSFISLQFVRIYLLNCFIHSSYSVWRMGTQCMGIEQCIRVIKYRPDPTRPTRLESTRRYRNLWRASKVHNSQFI